jgi:glucan phosphoethanolaminetransferase (alkaline phosphatase superfamily)
MVQQNYKNHAQFVVTYHVFTGLALVALIIGAIRNLLNTSEDNVYEASLLVLVSLILLSLYIHSRTFALKAQDRAIRAEESLRHYIITGKPIDPRLTLGQVIALRFASDEELPALAKEAAEKGWSNKEIKQNVKRWRADTHRV